MSESRDELLRDFFVNVVRRCAIIVVKWVEGRFTDVKPYGSCKH